MPYIKQEDRTKFAELIDGVILTIMRNSSPDFVCCEYFGFFVDRLTNRYIGAIDGVHPFNSMNFTPATRKAIEDYANKLASFLNRDTPLKSAGELNYIISSIWWGICGDHKDCNSASYGFRCVTRGMIEKILNNLDTLKFVDGSQQGMVMNSRLVITARGVLNDVISEMYRRRTAIYEESKIIENGDIWVKSTDNQISLLNVSGHQGLSNEQG